MRLTSILYRIQASDAIAHRHLRDSTVARVLHLQRSLLPDSNQSLSCGGYLQISSVVQVHLHDFDHDCDQQFAATIRQRHLGCWRLQCFYSWGLLLTIQTYSIL